jgi:pimeloyl-ACP methyl ester carboxylesterase
MAQTRYVAVTGGRIAYDDTGSGPLVILIAGLGDRRGAYRFLAPLLSAEGYRVVTVDLRGHGDSSAPWNDYSQTAVGLDIVALMEHLDPGGRAVLAGHSYAGGAVIWAATHAPALVAGVVPIDGFIRYVPLGFVTGAVVRLMASSAHAWSRYYRYAHRTAQPPDLTAWRKGLVAMLREPGRKQAMAAMLLGPTPEGERWAPAISCPALVIMGTKDPDFPSPAREAAFQARLLSGQAELIEGAGHYPHSEFPSRTAAALLPFLKKSLG